MSARRKAGEAKCKGWGSVGAGGVLLWVWVDGGVGRARAGYQGPWRPATNARTCSRSAGRTSPAGASMHSSTRSAMELRRGFTSTVYAPQAHASRGRPAAGYTSALVPTDRYTSAVCAARVACLFR